MSYLGRAPIERVVWAFIARDLSHRELSLNPIKDSKGAMVKEGLMVSHIESQRREFLGVLSELFSGGSLRKNASEQNVLAHRETTKTESRKRNIVDGNDLVYILNTGFNVSPIRGDGLSLDGTTYSVVNVAQDPLGVAYECECMLLE